MTGISYRCRCRNIYVSESKSYWWVGEWFCIMDYKTFFAEESNRFFYELVIGNIYKLLYTLLLVLIFSLPDKICITSACIEINQSTSWDFFSFFDKIGWAISLFQCFDWWLVDVHFTQKYHVFIKWRRNLNMLFHINMQSSPLKILPFRVRLDT